MIVMSTILGTGSRASWAQQPTSPAAPENNQSSSSPAKTVPEKTRPKRIVPDLSGFELDPKKSKSQNELQLGAGSRGASVSPALYAPRLGKAYSLRPTFFWGDLPGAQKLTFRLYDSDDEEVYEQEVAGSLGSFTYPDDAPPLKAGATYSWTVQAIAMQMATPPEPVQIMLVSGTERKSIEQALESIKGDALADRLKRVEVLIDHRLWYDSIAECTQLISKNRDNPELYRGRGQIYAQLPETRELANQDLDQADRLQHGMH
jgi:hypothetical protein